MLKFIKYGLALLIFQLITGKIYAGNKFAAMTYSLYNPASAIAACPDSRIWPYDPSNPFPDPEPNANGCGEISSQIAYACNPVSSNIGSTLLHSVVKIEVPDKTGNTLHICSATVINQQWVITAAHCVANFDVNSPLSGTFDPALKKFPIIVKSGSLEPESYIVKAVYISYHFNYYAEAYMQPYPGYLKDDFALLELKYPLPANFKPINLAHEVFPSEGPIEIWTAGYGLNENQTNHGDFHFRKQYYMTNIYDNAWDGGKSGNYGQIYTLGSIPEKYKGVYSAWSFNGLGDSGGPILLGNSTTHKFYLEGVYNGVINCMYTGYFAALPFPYGLSLSVPYYHDLIMSIMDGTALRSAARCVSPSGDCPVDNITYIANYSSNNISINYLDPETGAQSPLKVIVPTGGSPRKVIFEPKGWFAYVLNSGLNSVAMYQVRRDGYLLPMSPRNIEIAAGAEPVDIAYNKGYIYILDYALNSIYLYKIQADGSLVYKQNFLIPRPKSGPLSIKFDKNGSYAYIISTYGVLIYKVIPGGQIYYIDTLTISGAVALSFIRDGANQEYAYVLSSTAKTIGVYLAGDDGRLHLQQIVALNESPTDIEFSVDHAYAYVSHISSNRITIFKVNAHGHLEDVGVIATGAAPGGMSISPIGNNLLLTNPTDATVSVYKILNHVPWLEPKFKFSSRGYTPVTIAILPK